MQQDMLALPCRHCRRPNSRRFTTILLFISIGDTIQPGAALNPHATVCFVRHGQSQWNLAKRFTGWTDVELTDQGREEAKKGGAMLRGLNFDRAFTSELCRAQEVLRGMASIPAPVPYMERLAALSLSHNANCCAFFIADTRTRASCLWDALGTNNAALATERAPLRCTAREEQAGMCRRVRLGASEVVAQRFRCPPTFCIGALSSLPWKRSEVRQHPSPPSTTGRVPPRYHG